MSTRELKTIVRNIIALTKQSRYRDILTYTALLEKALSRYELASVKHAVREHLTH